MPLLVLLGGGGTIKWKGCVVPERPGQGESLCPPEQQGSAVSKEAPTVMCHDVLVTDAQPALT